jgi:SAM-dependent methyltransferase
MMRAAESRGGAAMGGAVDDGYILGRTEAEYARLKAQARVWEPVTLRVLAAAGLARGMRCLDAGCGPGEAMRLIARTVGPKGHVTGLDVDAPLGRHMLAELRREEGGSFDFVAADVTRGEAVPGAPFDLVFARLLLCHMTDPVAAVRALAAQLRPGGGLVLMDYDLTRLASRPEDPGLARAFEVIVRTFERSGRCPDAGLRLAEFLRSAGLPPPEGGEVAGLYAPIRVIGPMARSVIASLAQGAVALGVASAAEIDEVTARVAALEAKDRIFGLGPLMFGVWTAVPG